MIKIIAFRAEHAEELIERGRQDFGSLADADMSLRPYFDVLTEAQDQSYTVVDDGHLVLSAGIFEVWEAMGEAWLLPSQRLLEKPLRAIRVVKPRFEQIIERHGFRRVQATAHADFLRGQRFLEWLGFEQEGRLRKYGPDGADHIIYSRIQLCKQVQR